MLAGYTLGVHLFPSYQNEIKITMQEATGK